ncbi:MAG: lysophospholipase [Chloroflexi bacterium]|nr:MAG: lysophospholipase [Chloroflexota bacterium]
MSYQPQAPGDWGSMLETPGISSSTEKLNTLDACEHFLRSWKTQGSNVLLILHGLGGHSGWYIDMGNVLASHGITVYAMDHRGFGRSGGLEGHIDNYHTYVKDISFILDVIRKRHPESNIFLLGHSMGGLFATYVAAAYGEGLAGILLLNSWIQDTSQLPFFTMLAIVLGGLFKSKRYWQVSGGIPTMTTNPEAILMLQNDPLWRQRQTASMLFQLFLMRLVALFKARKIATPALVMQAAADKAVVVATNRKLYEAMASQDKTWKTYPGYAHDSEFEHDRTQLDFDIVTWISEHAVPPGTTSSAKPPGTS